MTRLRGLMVTALLLAASCGTPADTSETADALRDDRVLALTIPGASRTDVNVVLGRDDTPFASNTTAQASWSPVASSALGEAVSHVIDSGGVVHTVRCLTSTVFVEGAVHREQFSAVVRLTHDPDDRELAIVLVIGPTATPDQLHVDQSCPPQITGIF